MLQTPGAGPEHQLRIHTAAQPPARAAAEHRGPELREDKRQRIAAKVSVQHSQIYRERRSVRRTARATTPCLGGWVERARASCSAETRSGKKP